MTPRFHLVNNDMASLLRLLRWAWPRRPAPAPETSPAPAAPQAPKTAPSLAELLDTPARSATSSTKVGADFMEEVREPGPNRLFPQGLARTLDPSTQPDFEPWRSAPADYDPIGPDGKGRDYVTFNRAERVRYLMSMFHMHMRWNGEDGYNEMEIFHEGSLQVLRKSYPDIDKLMPTVLTALAYRWQTRPAVFVAVVNAAMKTDFMVDPSVPMNCYLQPGVPFSGPLHNHWG